MCPPKDGQFMTRVKACQTSKTSAPKAEKTRVMRTTDDLLADIRCIEDALLRVINLIESGTLTQRTTSYSLREVWLKLKRMSDMDEDKPDERTSR